jgi:predicted DNA-binding protein with PD1-like motif
MKVVNADLGKTVVLKIESGEDLLAGISEGAKAAGIATGIILNGIGSISRYHLHVVETSNLPPGNIFWKDTAPFDVDLINGYVIDGRVHAHVAVSNENATFGGHLEPGCEVLTFCLVTVAEAVDADFSQTDTYAGQRPKE